MFNSIIYSVHYFKLHRYRCATKDINVQIINVTAVETY